MKGFWKFLHWLVFRLRIYVLWSRVYNFFRNRKYREAWKAYLEWCGMESPLGVWDLTPEDERSPRILANFTLQEITDAVRLIEWKGDSWRAFWDAIAYPERMLFWISCKKFPPTDPKDPRAGLYLKLKKVQPQTEMDCDDFAVTVLYMLQRSRHGYELNGVEVIRDRPVWKGWFLNVARIEGRSFWGHNVALVRTPKGFYHTGNWGLEGPFPTVAKAIESVAGQLPLVGWAVLEPSNVSFPSSPVMKLKLIDRDGQLPLDHFLKEKNDE